ncbi:MAG: glycerate kinase [Saprospiraceae bacterium]|nr:glycerate kinase [Saprospiraceae bacterium]
MIIPLRRNMHILVTCDSYKDCLTADSVGDSIIEGINKVSDDLNVTHIPIADGGEGSLQAIQSYLSLQSINCNTLDPLLRPIESEYLLDYENSRAYIEMARASGLELLEKMERNCMETSSYGTGMMIKDAMDRGANEVVLFIGGSATSDMGIGMAAALGINFYDENENVLTHPVGKDLNSIVKVEGIRAVKNLNCLLACDVDNPLYGPNGASFTYGPQKGATPDDVTFLDEGMMRLNKIFHTSTGRDYAFANGAGAAGGIGAMAMYAFNTKVVNGATFMIDCLEIDRHVCKVDLVITGEGKMDDQTIQGKLINGISKLTRKYKKKLVVVCGIITLEEESRKLMGITESYSLSHISDHAPYTPESTKALLQKLGRKIAEKYSIN